MKYRQFRSPRNVGVKRVLGRASGRKVPPDNYDDINRSTNRHRCWKQYRRAQWHEARSN